MPEEPQHPMEPSLRAWADQRRERIGAAFELHPVDRRALQDEVRQVYAQPTAVPVGPTPLSWKGLLVRLAFAGGLGALLLLAILQLTPDRIESPMELARLDESAAPAPAPESRVRSAARPLPSDTLTLPGTPILADSVVAPVAGSAVAPPAPDAPKALADRYGVARASTPAPRPTSAAKQTSDEALAATASAPARPQPEPVLSETAGRRMTELSLTDRGLDRARVLSATAVAEQPGEALVQSPAAAPSPTGASSGNVAVRAEAFRPAASPEWSANFQQAQQLRRNFNAPPEVALQNFRLEQRGAEVQVVDEDGSAYRGQILTSGSWAQGFDFFVSGTNQTAQIPLVFQGNYTTGRTSRVQGQAVLGGRDRIMVDAVSAAAGH